MDILRYLRGMKPTGWILVAGLLAAVLVLLLRRGKARRPTPRPERNVVDPGRQDAAERRASPWAIDAGAFCRNLQERLARESCAVVTDDREQAYVEFGVGQGFPFRVERRERGGLMVSLRR